MCSTTLLMWFGALLLPIYSQPTDLFTGFFPCVPDTNMNSIHTQEDAQSCDLFVYAAVQLALDKITSSGEVDENGTRLGVLSLEIGNSETIMDVLYDVYVQISHTREEFSQSIEQTRACIGTDNEYVQGLPVVSIAEDMGVPIISYGLVDSRLNEFPNFYRTIPSTNTLNQARIKLMVHFEWFRIAILGSSDIDYSFQMENFTEYLNLNLLERQIDVELSYKGTTTDLSSSLRDLHRFDIRIIMGFFGPEESRLVLCEASSSNYSLTTPDHVWILPSYYNPDWWKGGGDGYHSDQQTRTCTDEDMMDILNSVIFIDPVKYPPMGTTLSEFYPALLNKTRELFSELDPEVPLERLLQHSRAVSAYDSTLLLAHSLSDGEINRTRLDRLIECELCRVYPENYEYFLTCRNECRLGIDHVTQIMRSTHLQAYGQVLVSQFVDGTHCPMALFWWTPEDLLNNFVSVNDLDKDATSRYLELDPRIRFPNIHVVDCPRPGDFYWKERNSPPISNVLAFSEIPEWSLVFVGLVIGVGEVIIVALIVFSIVWRENRHVKPTSPRINILILTGAAITLPNSLVDGITLSARRYQLTDPAATVLCQLSLWVPILGITLLTSAILVKIYRLYRIFHNTALKKNLKYMKDRDLIVMAFCLTIPVFIALILWNSFSLWQFKTMLVENGILQYIQLTLCASDSALLSGIIRRLIRTLLLFMFGSGVGMSLFLTRTTPAIKIDILATRSSFVMGACVAVAAFTVEDVVLMSPLDYELDWWARVFQWVVSPILLTCGLFLYQVIFVLRDYRKKVKEKQMYRETNCKCDPARDEMAAQSYYNQLLQQIKELSGALAEKEAAIRHMKAQNPISDTDQAETLILSRHNPQ